jgi:uncharacterized protein (DUF2141 family)
MLIAAVAAYAALAPATGRAEPTSACTGPVSGTRLRVQVQGVRSGVGLIAVTLYPDDRRRFLAKRGSLYVGRVPAHQGQTNVCLYVPRPGTYALAVYHDRDANRSFGRTRLGLPAEGFGFSNNPPTLFGLPSFAKVRFAIPRSDMRTVVKLDYP